MDLSTTSSTKYTINTALKYFYGQTSLTYSKNFFAESSLLAVKNHSLTDRSEEASYLYIKVVENVSLIWWTFSKSFAVIDFFLFLLYHEIVHKWM